MRFGWHKRARCKIIYCACLHDVTNYCIYQEKWFEIVCLGGQRVSFVTSMKIFQVISSVSYDGCAYYTYLNNCQNY